MRVYPDKLDAALAKGLKPIYLFCGEEPLQREESADAVRRIARQQGVSGREIYHVDNAHFDWSALLAGANSLSLFAERKLLEVRLHTSGPGRDGGAAIRSLAELDDPDTTMMIIAGKLDRGAAASAWYKAIDKHGIVVTSWPITGVKLQRWIRQRLQAAGIRADSAAVDVIAGRVEGNLLAAKQEIDRLTLLCDKGRLDGDSAAQLVADSARYNEYALADRALFGRRDEAMRILNVLATEAIPPLRVLWALSREIRHLLTLGQATSIDRAFADLKIPAKRRSVYTGALRRLHADTLASLLQQAAQVDRCIKGMRPGDEWEQLGRLVLAMTETPAGR